MTKNLLLILLGGMMGYFLYPYVHPTTPQEELLTLVRSLVANEARTFADARTAQEKLTAADRLYEKMMLIFLSQLKLETPENLPIDPIPTETLGRKPVLVQTVPTVPVELEIKEDGPLTLAEKLRRNLLDMKSYLSFSGLPYLNSLDSRIEKLKGVSKGKLRQKFQSRTGAEESVTLTVGDLTKLDVVDSYDNVTISYSGTTSQSFQSVQGDENLLLLVLPESRFVVLDFQRYPSIIGKVFTLNKHTADFEVKKIR